MSAVPVKDTPTNHLETQSKEALNKKRDKPSQTKERKKKSVDQEDNSGKKEKGEKSISVEEKNANIKKWAKSLHNLNCKDMSKEFNQKMKRFVAPGATFTVCKKETNEMKCRYADVLCLDKTRVPLKGRPKDEDFIHANWVGAPGGTKYICTQAPLKETVDDFWHMCYKEKVSIILMLCNYKEGTELEKCFHYFPEAAKEKMKCGDYTVTMKEKLDDPEIEDTDFRVLEVKYKDESIKIKHCFMRYWVDNCAPVETEPILKLWRWVRKYHNDKPVVVHCSAGVGRTSTFVGIEFAIQQIPSNPDIHMLEIVKDLRKQRYQSIQSHVQFLYLHYLVLDHYVHEGVVEQYKNSKFVEEYRRHTQKRTTRAKKDAKKQVEKELEKEPNSKKPADSDADN